MTDADITKIYSGPVQGGGELPFFTRKQYGNGWLRTLGRFAFPILRRIINIAMNTGSDMIDGRKKFTDSLMENAKNEIPSFFTGQGMRRRKRPINSNQIEIPGSIFSKKRKTT